MRPSGNSTVSPMSPLPTKAKYRPYNCRPSSKTWRHKDSSTSEHEINEPGQPGQLPARASHKSGRAQLRPLLSICEPARFLPLCRFFASASSHIARSHDRCLVRTTLVRDNRRVANGTPGRFHLISPATISYCGKEVATSRLPVRFDYSVRLMKSPTDWLLQRLSRCVRFRRGIGLAGAYMGLSFPSL